MGEGVYRDGLAGVRMRVEELAREVADREARLTTTFWERIPAALAERLRRQKSEAFSAHHPSLGSLTHAAEALLVYLRGLDDAIGRVPSMQNELFALPDVAPSPGLDLPAWAVFFGGGGAGAPITDAYAGDVKLHGAALRKALGAPQYQEVAFDAQGLSLLAQFRCKGAPFTIGTAPAFAHNEYLGGAQVAIATSVSQATPRLVLRAETWGDDVLRSVGSKDMGLGDMTFDGLFLVQGDPEARGMLSPESRAALLRIAKYDVPSLVVEHAEARLHWRWEPDGAMIDAAVQVLSGIRNGTARLEMLR